MTEPVLRVSDLRVHFPVRRGLLARRAGTVKAVDGLSLCLNAGRTLALVGESGCGKSTTARAILRLVPATAGRIELGGTDIGTLGGRRLRQARRDAQMVFQDPHASLDPRMTVLDIIAEPLRAHGIVRARGAMVREVAEIMEQVGLCAAFLRRYPHELSGGQCQRVGIARALALRPKVIIADEPLSALDLSIRAQIINLLVDLQRKTDIAYLLIAHDLAVVRHIAHDVAVMYLGRVVEQAPAERLFARPGHPYSQALLSAMAVPDPVCERGRQRLPLAGEPPSPLDPPAGCAFHPRCRHAFAPCRGEEPALRDRGDGQLVRCHLDEPPAFAAPWHRAGPGAAPGTAAGAGEEGQACSG
ncbi:MAG: ATP-binding cassette domain-containing protein [Deltaproteobacteria bacterium]|nr:ATP-binding cassette domain-containing protein [Deltaproteobacteria bacterium]